MSWNPTWGNAPSCRRCGRLITPDQYDDAWPSGDSAWFHGECPVSPFREKLAEHLTGRWTALGSPEQWSPQDITDVQVSWSEGDQGTDDYGDEYIRLPYLEIYVEGIGGRRTAADPGWVIAELMKQALE